MKGNSLAQDSSNSSILYREKLTLTSKRSSAQSQEVAAARLGWITKSTPVTSCENPQLFLLPRGNQVYPLWQASAFTYSHKMGDFRYFWKKIDWNKQYDMSLHHHCVNKWKTSEMFIARRRKTVATCFALGLETHLAWPLRLCAGFPAQQAGQGSPKRFWAPYWKGFVSLEPSGVLNILQLDSITNHGEVFFFFFPPLVTAISKAICLNTFCKMGFYIINFFWAFRICLKKFIELQCVSRKYADKRAFHLLHTLIINTQNNKTLLTPQESSHFPLSISFIFYTQKEEH